jgi:hypothetical protein
LNLRRTTGVNKTGKAASIAHFVDESNQVVPIIGVRFGIAFRIFLFLVVVSEFNEDVITLSQLCHDRLPAPFVDKALRASAVLRVILDLDLCLVELDLQVFTPTCLGSFVRSLLGKRRVARQVDDDWLSFLRRSFNDSANNDECRAKSLLLIGRFT